MTAGIVVEAAGLYAAANLDAILMLSLFFGRGAGEPGAVRRIVAGQFLSFAVLLAISVAAAYGATFLPLAWIAYLGLLPLALGLLAARKVWRDYRNGGSGRPGDDQPGQVTMLRVAAVMFANTSDDIGVYVPVFARTGVGELFVYGTIFLILTGIWCVAGWFFATRPAVAEVIDRWGDILQPLVLIAIGLFILIKGGAFAL